MSELLLKTSHFFFSFSLTFLLLKKFIPILRKIIPVLPNERGMHDIVKPSSGGISFILIYFLLALYQGFYLPIFSMPMAIIGFLDDKYNLSKLFRFLSQCLSLLIIVIYLKNNPNSLVNQINYLGYLGYIVLIFIGVAIINFINFMDGIDGLICGSMITIFITLNGQVHYLIPIIGTLSAFLYFNWYPSKIFMGDTGSLFLGTYLVSIMYSSSSNLISFFKICLLCSPLLMDALICIIRRYLNKQNIFNAHKSHLYQRLVSNGIKHSTVSLIYILSIALLSIIYLHSSILILFLGTILVFFIGVFIDKKYALDFNKTFY